MAIPLIVKRIAIFLLCFQGVVGIAEACPPADTGSGRGPTETSGRRPRRKRWEGPERAKRTESFAIPTILPLNI